MSDGTLAYCRAAWKKVVLKVVVSRNQLVVLEVSQGLLFALGRCVCSAGNRGLEGVCEAVLPGEWQ